VCLSEEPPILPRHLVHTGLLLRSGRRDGRSRGGNIRLSGGGAQHQRTQQTRSETANNRYHLHPPLRNSYGEYLRIHSELE